MVHHTLSSSEAGLISKRTFSPQGWTPQCLHTSRWSCALHSSSELNSPMPSCIHVFLASSMSIVSVFLQPLPVAHFDERSQCPLSPEYPFQILLSSVSPGPYWMTSCRTLNSHQTWPPSFECRPKWHIFDLMVLWDMLCCPQNCCPVAILQFQ